MRILVAELRGNSTEAQGYSTGAQLGACRQQSVRSTRSLVLAQSSVQEIILIDTPVIRSVETRPSRRRSRTFQKSSQGPLHGNRYKSLDSGRSRNRLRAGGDCVPIP